MQSSNCMHNFFFNIIMWADRDPDLYQLSAIHFLCIYDTNAGMQSRNSSINFFNGKYLGGKVPGSILVINYPFFQRKVISYQLSTFHVSMIKRTGMWPGAPAGCVSPFLQRKVITEQLKPFKHYPYSSLLVLPLQ